MQKKEEAANALWRRREKRSALLEFSDFQIALRCFLLSPTTSDCISRHRNQDQDHQQPHTDSMVLGGVQRMEEEEEEVVAVEEE